MCGIAGVVAAPPSRPNIREIAIEMGAMLKHRGPDAGGIWADLAAGVAFAHRRLSVVDLTPTGAQPMESASRRWVISYNGEIYNHQQLRARINSRKEVRWRGTSDTETFLELIDLDGVGQALAATVGMFAFALWDKQERTLFLARDRMGEKPLYYGFATDALVFGSELKSIERYPGLSPEIDRDALCLLLRHNYIPAPFSIYRGILKLPAGCFLEVKPEHLRQRQLPSPTIYWSLLRSTSSPLTEPFHGTEAEALRLLEERANEAISLQRIADVPIGVFLSGGVDSSVIASLMQMQSSQRIKTFTVGFSEKAYDEAPFARAVAKSIGSDHTELRLTAEEAREVIPLLPQIYDEPFSDSSQIPTFLVSRLARTSVTVALSGDGGDELFGGYNRYFLGRRIRQKLMWLPVSTRRMLAGMILRCPPHVLDAILRPFGRLISDFRVALPSDKAYKAAEVFALADNSALYRRLVSHWDDPAAIVVRATEPPTVLDHLLGRSDIASTLEQWMMTTDAITYLPDDILVKVDRASMAVSLETRAPFLDHRLVEFAMSLPLEMKVRGRRGKHLLRQLLYRRVPARLFDRPKMGFALPIDAWLRGPLQEWAEDLLSEDRLTREGFFVAQPIRQKWKEHKSGTRNWQYHLWDVLMFQAWLEARSA